MLRLKPTYEEMLREAKTRRLRILPERERRTQQGILIEDVDFDDFDLDKFNIRNPNKATQTDIFDDNNSNYSNIALSQSTNAPSEIERNEQQQRQTSNSTGESLDDVRYRTRVSIADDLATMARLGGNVIYYTGQGIGQGMSAVIDAYNWINEDNDEDNDENEQPEAPMDEGMYEQTQGLMRRGASRSRSQSSRASDEAAQTPEERASGSNQAMRLMRRGASRSRSETPPKKKYR